MYRQVLIALAIATIAFARPQTLSTFANAEGGVDAQDSASAEVGSEVSSDAGQAEAVKTQSSNDEPSLIRPLNHASVAADGSAQAENAAVAAEAESTIQKRQAESDKASSEEESSGTSQDSEAATSELSNNDDANPESAASADVQAETPVASADTSVDASAPIVKRQDAEANVNVHADPLAAAGATASEIAQGAGSAAGDAASTADATASEAASSADSTINGASQSAADTLLGANPSVSANAAGSIVKRSEQTEVGADASVSADTQAADNTGAQVVHLGESAARDVASSAAQTSEQSDDEVARVAGDAQTSVLGGESSADVAARSQVGNVATVQSDVHAGPIVKRQDISNPWAPAPSDQAQESAAEPAHAGFDAQAEASPVAQDGQLTANDDPLPAEESSNAWGADAEANVSADTQVAAEPAGAHAAGQISL